MPFPIAETITAAGTIGAGALNVQSASKTNLKTRKHNEHMFRWQHEVATKDWEKQNEYNSPKQQMKRLKEAGLNPALVYGQGATGSNASAVNQPSMGSYNPNVPQFDEGAIGESLGGIAQGQMAIQKSLLQQNLENAKRQGELIDAQAAASRASADKTAEEATGQRIHNAEAGGHLTLTDEQGQPIHEKKYLADYSSTASNAHLRAGELANQKRAQQDLHEFTQKSIAEKQKQIEAMEQQIANAKYDGDVKKLHSDLAKKGINPTANITTEYWQQLRQFLKLF